MKNNCEIIGMLNGRYGNLLDVNRRVYSTNGVSPTITTCGGGNTEPKIMEFLALDEQNKTIRQDTIGTLTTDGSSPKHNNRMIECYGIQRNVTKAFMKKPLKECSRTILANKSFGGGGGTDDEDGYP